MDKTAERLLSFAGSLRFADLEPQVLHAIKQRFIVMHNISTRKCRDSNYGGKAYAWNDI